MFFLSPKTWKCERGGENELWVWGWGAGEEVTVEWFGESWAEGV